MLCTSAPVFAQPTLKKALEKAGHELTGIDPCIADTATISSLLRTTRPATISQPGDSTDLATYARLVSISTLLVFATCLRTCQRDPLDPRVASLVDRLWSKGMEYYSCSNGHPVLRHSALSSTLMVFNGPEPNLRAISLIATTALTPPPGSTWPDLLAQFPALTGPYGDVFAHPASLLSLVANEEVHYDTRFDVAAGVFADSLRREERDRFPDTRFVHEYDLRSKAKAFEFRLQRALVEDLKSYRAAHGDLPTHVADSRGAPDQSILPTLYQYPPHGSPPLACWFVGWPHVRFVHYSQTKRHWRATLESVDAHLFFTLNDEEYYR